MAITPAGFDLLRKSFDRAAAKKVLLYDIMTERYEIASMLQRELARMPELFGTLQKGTPDQPGVVIESVHHFFKEVAGKPLIRPAWFYDVQQQGESVPDVGTHLVDAVQWIMFPRAGIGLGAKTSRSRPRAPLVHQAEPPNSSSAPPARTLTRTISKRISARTVRSKSMPTAKSHTACAAFRPRSPCTMEV